MRGSSDSLRSSSVSSDDDRAAAIDGEYRVAAVDPIEGRPGMMRLTMDPLAAADGRGRIELDLPDRALGEQPILPGDTVAAQHRPYGVEFARGATREAFFLVLADDWSRDMATRPVVR